MSAELPVILPTLTGEQIAQICAEHSTPECEVCAIVESINGHPVIRLARSYREMTVLPRRQAG